MNDHKSVFAFVVLCSILPALASCGGKKGGESAAAPAGIEKRSEKGPASVVLRTDRRELTVADQLNVSIEASAEAGYSIELPPVGDKLDEFAIIDFKTEPPRLGPKGSTILRRSYVLEPFLSGDYRIPPMTLRFTSLKDKAGQPHEISTEGITISVKSLRREQVDALKLHEIAPPVALPRKAVWKYPAAVLAVIAAAIAAVLLARRLSRRGPAAAGPPPRADETAFRELEALVAADLVGRGEIKEFHRRISDILRRYIENRFGIHAPEQTTEEFLAVLSVNGVLASRYRGLLGEFLGHCDLVKFAEHQPARDDIQKTFDLCKNFIMETAVRVESTPVQATAGQREGSGA